MNWARLTAVALMIWSGHAVAQSADRSISGLETCFRAARLADTICERQSDPQTRLDCFEKTRGAQLECLAHVLPDDAHAAMKPSEAAPPASRPATAPEAPKQDSAKEVGSTGPPKTTSTKQEPPKSDSDANAAATSGPADVPTAAVRPAPTPQPGPPLPQKTWTLSETTSPVDYSPLITAVLAAEQQTGNGPSTLTIRCRAKRTELSVQFAGEPGLPKAGDIQIDYRLDDQPPVKQRWGWSADAKIATYRDDPVSILQSIREGAQLTIGASEGSGATQPSTFKLSGLDSIRKKVAAACNWPPQRASSEKR